MMMFFCMLCTLSIAQNIAKDMLHVETEHGNKLFYYVGLGFLVNHAGSMKHHFFFWQDIPGREFHTFIRLFTPSLTDTLWFWFWFWGRALKCLPFIYFFKGFKWVYLKVFECKGVVCLLYFPQHPKKQFKQPLINLVIVRRHR